MASLPRMREKAVPAPKDTAFTAGTAKRYWEKMPSAFSPKSGPPSPAGRPNRAHSTAPPTESCSSFASRMAWRIRSPASSSITGNSLREAAYSSSAVSQQPSLSP